MIKKLLSIDEFGYTYEFWFNKKGGSYKTTPGGFMTLIIRILLLWQGVSQIILMATR